jgi:uncharacterized phage-associated protein
VEQKGFDREKFKRLVHYVIWKVGDTPNFGATKLNKVLWYAEARHYMRHKKPITGATYVREKHGPVARAMKPVQDELASSGYIKISKDFVFKYDRWRFHALKEPDVSIFAPEELGEVDWWADHIAHKHTAKSISEESHDYAWEIAGLGEVIPFHAIFANRARPSEGEELEWAKKRAKELGLH